VGTRKTFGLDFDIILICEHPTTFILTISCSIHLLHHSDGNNMHVFPFVPFSLGVPVQIRIPFPLNPSKCVLTPVYDSLNSFGHSLQTHAYDPPPKIFPMIVTYFQSGDFGSTLGVDSISCSSLRMNELEVSIMMM